MSWPITRHALLHPAMSACAYSLCYNEARMQTLITLPGIGGSGDCHWQTAWERADPQFKRFQPASWEEPDLCDWIQSLQRTVIAAKRPPVIVAHSLACLLVAHWAARLPADIAGAFLVSVPDSDGPNFPKAASFRASPTAPLPFPSVIVASTNDPYGRLD